MKKNLLLLLCFLYTAISFAQDDLLSELDSTQVIDKTVTASFKGLQIITLQSTKLPAKKNFTWSYLTDLVQ